MNKLAVSVVLVGTCLSACKPDEDYKKQKPPEEPAAVEAPKEKAPPPPPPKKKKTPEELGDCKLTASGAFSAEQTTHGGIEATNVSYWMGEADRAKMTGVDGFAVMCKAADIKFSLVPGGKKDGMPFGPKKYDFKKSKGDASLVINVGPGGAKTLDAIDGTVDITAFDKKHIAGTIAVSGKLVPGGGVMKLTGSFDLGCPGFAACEE